MKILIIQTAFLGDVVLATAVAEKLHAFYPEAALYFLVKKGNESLLAEHPYIRETWVYEKKRQKLRNLWRLLRQIRSSEFDIVVNLHRHISSGFLTAFSGAEQKIGFDKNPLSGFFTHTFPHYIDDFENPMHEVDRNNSLIAHLTDENRVPPRLYPRKQDWEAAKKPGPYVCMAPASIWFTKMYPQKKWVELIDGMDPDTTVYLIGGKEDIALCEWIQFTAQHQKTEVLAGQMGLLASAALMKGAVMNVVNDSAPLHLASAVDAPVIGIFCSTIPQFGFDPLSTVSHVIETEKQLDCRPCGLHGKKACPLGHFECGDIEVGRILRLIP